MKCCVCQSSVRRGIIPCHMRTWLSPAGVLCCCHSSMKTFLEGSRKSWASGSRWAHGEAVPRAGVKMRPTRRLCVLLICAPVCFCGFVLACLSSSRYRRYGPRNRSNSAVSIISNGSLPLRSVKKLLEKRWLLSHCILPKCFLVAGSTLLCVTLNSFNVTEERRAEHYFECFCHKFWIWNKQISDCNCCHGFLMPLVLKYSCIDVRYQKCALPNSDKWLERWFQFPNKTFKGSQCRQVSTSWSLHAANKLVSLFAGMWSRRRTSCGFCSRLLSSSIVLAMFNFGPLSHEYLTRHEVFPTISCRISCHTWGCIPCLPVWAWATWTHWQMHCSWCTVLQVRLLNVKFWTCVALPFLVGHFESRQAWQLMKAWSAGPLHAS